MHAQPVNVQQFQNTQQAQQLQAPLVNPLASTNAPELYPGEDVDVGPQRILRLNPRHKYFDVVLDSQVFYSDKRQLCAGFGRRRQRGLRQHRPDRHHAAGLAARAG
ncbi:MAG: hypothetical protein WDN00_17975 [Limisphaerales bacterium]